MKILVIGSGAREHTLVWKLAQSPKVKEMFAAPGNAGTARLAQNVDIPAEDIEALLKFARENTIDLTVVGPEGPLSKGIVDSFEAAGLAIFGASKAAAEIETSKIFAKRLMQKHGIPCGGGEAFTEYEPALEYARKQRPPIVVKADGLAAGKGVIIAESFEEAEAGLKLLMKDRSLGAAADRVIIEEHLNGREVSVFAFTDGRTVIPMVPACDYKRVFDGGLGPNTGGMGSYSPPPFYSQALDHVVTAAIMKPTIMALADENREYRGVLYGGLMITNNVPKVLEFNARFGDPETQVVLPRLKTDLVDIMLAVLDIKLDTIDIEWSDNACVGVVMASGGYPGSYKTGFAISGLDEVDKDIMIFHAGTKIGPEGQALTAGGRVLTVAATGANLAAARERVYQNISRISFEGCHYRRDIADI